MRDPQVLYNIVTHILIGSFIKPTTYSKSTEENEDIKKGIYTSTFLDNYIKSDPDIKKHLKLISWEDIIFLLQELRIMARYHDSQSEPDHDSKQEAKYFVPCVLNHLEEAPMPEGDTGVPLLAVKFLSNHCPKGMFGVLVHYLLTDNSNWKLERENVFKDQVSFEVGAYKDIVTLKALPKHFELNFHSCERPIEEDPKFHVKVIRHQVREALYNGTLQAVRDLHYNKEKINPMLALVCKVKNEVLHEIKDSNFPCSQCSLGHWKGGK